MRSPRLITLTIAALALAAGMQAPAMAAQRPAVTVSTGENLPPLQSTVTYDAGPGFAPQITGYQTSGAWARDRARVVARASAFLRTWLRTTCADHRHCRPAVVFDIDDTLVSWYPLLAASGFAYDSAVNAAAVNGCQTPLIRTTAALFAEAKRLGVDVFLITGRKEPDRAATISCLTSLGLTGWSGLTLRSPDQDDATATAYKSAARRDIERRGWRIALAIGDQVSDSAGGATDGAFVLPNPMYFIP